MIYVFGAGAATVRFQRGGTGQIQSRQIPTLKEISLKIDGKLESQFGSAVHAEDAASGERKITGTIKWGAVGARLMNDILFGGTRTAGHPVVVLGSQVAALTPVSDDVNVGQTNITDMGVISGVDGYPLDRVAPGAEAAGTYSVVEATGIYSFGAADPRAATVRPSYRYTDGASGATYEMGNPLQGTLVDTELVMWKPRFAKHLGVIVYHAVYSGLDLASKGSSYTDPSSNFECFVDQARNSPGQIFSSEALD